MVVVTYNFDPEDLVPENSLLEEHLMFDHIAKIRKFVKLEVCY
jgi:hypothetical protein